MEESFKTVNYYDDYVIIHHYILMEYEETVNNPKITYEIYKEECIKTYKLAEKIKACEILEMKFYNLKKDDPEDEIIIKMPKYEILYNNMQEYQDKNLFVEKFCKLLDEMWENKIIHMDLAFRNIGKDNDGNFKLIDLSDIAECNDYNQFIKWFLLYGMRIQTFSYD